MKSRLRRKNTGCRKEGFMNNQKLTILYERLSREDERENESVSIEYQKSFLEDYAVKNGLTNFVHITDDGWSGTRWDRPGFLKMMEKVDSGVVGQICIKDMSRLGRDHLRVGLFLEQLREQEVRLLAVAEGIDTAKGEDDFMPFRNIIAEWQARDTSRKIKAIFGARTAQGKHVSGALPYGYIHDPNDRQQWILDDVAAPIVARIFKSIINGMSITQVADELTAEKVLTPTAHWTQIGAGMPGKPTANPTRWSASTIITITQKQEYMGWKILNKTVKETYKSKRKKVAPEDMLITKGAYPAIVDEETWNVVQRLRATKRKPERITGAPHPLTGVLFCHDCGAKMYHKQGKTGREKVHHEYTCSSYRHYSRSCTCHYIRVEVVENLILETIRNVSRYVKNNESEFMERVRKTSAIQQEEMVKECRKKAAQAKRRREEVSGLVKKLYEAYAANKIPEKHFTDLLADYDKEQTGLDKEISELKTAIDGYNSDSVRADKFIELVKRHTEFNEFSATLLNEFVEKIIVHEAVKVDGIRTMQVDIYLNFIGKFELPDAEPLQAKLPPPKGTKKLRKDMTAEEIEILRVRDRERYAVKRNARIAAEQAVRDEILKGTSFETASQEKDINQAAS